MDKKELDKEKRIYQKIDKLKEGNKEDKLLAIECIGILSNELTEESFENRLNIVENKIDKLNRENYSQE